MTEQSAKYDPSIFFTPTSFEAALAIAITAEDTTTERRMKVETPYFVDLMDEHIKLPTFARVLDYGCGPGRISKEILTRHDVRVYGADISPRMLAFATAHANSQSFAAIAPAMLDDMPQFDAIVLTWVLQHVPDVERTVSVLMNKLKPHGRMFVVNAHEQILPTEGYQWLRSTQTNVLELLRTKLKQVAFGATLDPEKTSPMLSEHAWWGVFESRVAWHG